MIAKARTIPHGEAMTQYTMRNNRADIVKVNLLSEGLPYMGMWEEMCMHMERFKYKHSRKPIEKTSISIEVSPSKDESANWTLDDWRQFVEEFVAELDKTTEGVDRNGNRRIGLKPTNIANSQYFAALHHDAKSGIPHLHIVVNRIDIDGNTNDGNYIGERAVLAAQRINARHGWNDTMEIRGNHIKQVNADCWDVLRSLPSFSWNAYFDALRQKGYEIKLPKGGELDKNGNVRSYSIAMGNCRYRASDLGKGRCFTASKIEDTYNKLHPKPKVTLPESPIARQAKAIKGNNPDVLLLFRLNDGNLHEAYNEDAEIMAKLLGLQILVSNRYSDGSGNYLKGISFGKDKFDEYLTILTGAGYRVGVCDQVKGQERAKTFGDEMNSNRNNIIQDRYRTIYSVEDNVYNVDIPNNVYNVINENTVSPENGNATHEDVVKVGVLLFLNYVSAATTYAESHGGSGTPGSGWGKKRDEDDNDWAKRCAQKASWLCKPTGKRRGRN